MEQSSAENFIQQRPHVVLSMAWISTWVRQYYYLSDSDEEVKAYNNHYSDENIAGRQPFGQDLIDCISDFYTCFLEQGYICEINHSAFQDLPERFGKGEASFPLREKVLQMSERDQHMFRSLTIDVFLSVCNSVVAHEIGKRQQKEDEYVYIHLKRPPSDTKDKTD